MNSHLKFDKSILPRLLRLNIAHFYMGMDRNRFNKEVRPDLTEIPIGKQGIAFDRLELDSWVDQYISRNGRPSKKLAGEILWDDKKERLVSSRGTASGTSTNKSTGSEFARVRALLTLKGQKKS